MRTPSLAVLLLAVAAVACGRAPGAAANDPAAATSVEKVRITTAAGTVAQFRVELAATDEERATGLMYRREMAEDAGMLFDFGPEPRPVSMWMKNTLIPLDMAFIDADGVIVTIAANTTPRSLTSIPSRAPVVAVLEVNGGALARAGVAEGDVVRHPWFEKR